MGCVICTQSKTQSKPSPGSESEQYESDEEDSSSESSYESSSFEEIDKFDHGFFNSAKELPKKQYANTSLAEMNTLDPSKGGPDISKSRLDSKSQLNSEKKRNKLSSLGEIEEPEIEKDSNSSSPIQV